MGSLLEKEHFARTVSQTRTPDGSQTKPEQNTDNARWLTESRTLCMKACTATVQEVPRLQADDHFGCNDEPINDSAISGTAVQAQGCMSYSPSSSSNSPSSSAVASWY